VAFKTEALHVGIRYRYTIPHHIKTLVTKSAIIPSSTGRQTWSMKRRIKFMHYFSKTNVFLRPYEQTRMVYDSFLVWVANWKVLILVNGQPVLISKQNFVFSFFPHVSVRDTDFIVATVCEKYPQMERTTRSLKSVFRIGICLSRIRIQAFW
jgi:hypothetical protein